MDLAILLHLYDLFFWWVWLPRFVLKQFVETMNKSQRHLPRRYKYKHDESDSEDSDSSSESSSESGDESDNSDLSSDGL